MVSGQSGRELLFRGHVCTLSWSAVLIMGVSVALHVLSPPSAAMDGQTLLVTT
jgi:hypothetical protein